MFPGSHEEEKIMKLKVPFGTGLPILLFLVLACILVAGVSGEGVTGQVSPGKSTTPAVDTPVLEGLGITAADQQTLMEQAKKISDRYQSTTTQNKPALSAAGNYREDSMEKITTSNGKPFEGGTTITFTISPDNQVSGKVDFKFIEQGWTIKVHGTVTGFLTPDTGKLVIKSDDASVKYAGKQYPLTMTVDARYDGSGFVGTKVLTFAGTSGTLGFEANPA